MKNNWNRIKDITNGLKGLAAIGISDIVGNGISAIFWFYMATILGAKNYGEISYFLAIGSIASTVSLMGAQNTLTVYTAKNVKIQSPIYFISLISSSITSIVLFFTFYNLGLSVYILGTVIFGLATSEILGLKLYNTYSKYLIIQKILMVVLAVGLYYWIGAEGVILGIAFSFFPYIVRIHKGFKDSKINFFEIRTRFGFIINNYVLSLTGTVNGSIDKLIIVPILGFTILGNYQLGMQFLSVLQILPTIVYKYILPHDASGSPNKKLKIATILVSIGLAILGILLSPIVIPLLFPKFMEAIQVIQIVSLSIVPTSINLTYQSKFLGSEKIRTVLLVSGIYLVIQIVTIILLGNLYGINGVAAAYVLSVSIETLSYLFIDKFLKKLN